MSVAGARMPVRPTAAPGALGRADAGWAAAVVLAVALVYVQVRDFGLLSWDDPGYLTNSTLVRQAFGWPLLRDTFAAFHMANWHPLTLMSHWLDVRLFGFDAGAHHLVSVGWHAVASLLVLLLVRRWGGAPTVAGVLALLFAVHPLHVESVVWLSERKDLLSAVGWLPALLAYDGWVRTGGAGRYAAVTAATVLALLSKPMAVTLPATMLLLDLWIYRRGGSGGGGLRRLVGEKLPWIAAAAAVAGLTVMAQQGAGAQTAMANTLLLDRAAHALVAYAAYLGQSVVPVGLIYLYELKLPVPVLQWLAAGALIGGLSAGLFRLRARAPWAWVGWLWFLGTLVPVIGLMQVGVQARADRYMYIPLFGLLLAAGLGPDWSALSPRTRRIAAGVALAVVLGYGVLAQRQVAVWHSSESLYRHALSIDPGHCRARSGLAGELLDQRRLAEVAGWVEQVGRECPDDELQRLTVLQRSRLALRQGRLNDAQRDAEAALQRWPGDLGARVSLGLVLIEQKRFAEAIDVLWPVNVDLRADYYSRGLLGEALLQSPKHAALALAHYRDWAAASPTDPAVLYGLGIAEEQGGDAARAATAYRAVLALDPRHLPTRLRLARLTLAGGDVAGARAQFAAILADNPGQPLARAYLDRMGQNGQ